MILIFFLFYGFALVAPYPEPFYRKDYTYVAEFDAFYKVHWTDSGLSWSSVFMACDDEGSSIFYPKVAQEWSVVTGIVSKMKNKPNEHEVFLGMHYVVDLDEFITVDGNGMRNPSSTKNETDSLSEDETGVCVTMDMYNGMYKLQSCSNLSNVTIFVCKKEVVVQACPTVDTGYEYVKGTGRCFKFHDEKKKTWKKAMQTCFTEGGNLAIVKNSIEAEIIRNKMSLYNIDYFVGFRLMESNTSDRHFFTVQGHKLDNSSYIRWVNNVTYDTKDDCGVIFNFKENLYSMTKNCDDPSPFLCEMSSKSHSLSAFKCPISHDINKRDTTILEHSMMNDDADSIVFKPVL